ncbi:MAG: trigger factor [Firmicutes bacterium]|nr:trigger factor [Bacillota bacterium]
MKYTVTVEKGEALMNFEVEATAWEKALDEAHKKNGKKFSVQGFRKGTAPRKLIEKHYGPDVYFDDAFDVVARNGYRKVLEEKEELFPVDGPRVENIEPSENGNIKFTMRVTLKPELTLGQYKGIKIDQVEYTVENKEIEAELTATKERGARMVAVERATENGDTVTFDFEGSIDGVKFDGGTAQNHRLVIGSGQFIPGFEEQMIGIKIGEEKDVNVSFPEDYHAENLKGKPAVFKVKVNAIEVKELPELTDEYIKDSTPFETLAEYKKDIKQRLTEHKEHKQKDENRIKILEAIAENTKVEIPDCMVEDELDSMLEEFSQRLQYMYQGMKIDDYFKYTQSSEEDYRKQNREEAKRAVKTRMIMQEIIKQEKIKPEKSAEKAKLLEVIKRMGKDEKRDLEEFQKKYESGEMDFIKHELVLDELFVFLEKNNELVVGKDLKMREKSKK